MSSYTERLAAMPEPRRTEYVSNEDFRKQKAALTRAKNSGDPARVLRTVEETLEAWRGRAWPDDWNRWRIALEDAAQDARRQAYAAESREDWDESDRLEALSTELHAASLILF